MLGKQGIYIKYGWSDFKFNIMNQIFYFLNFEVFINILGKKSYLFG